MSTVIDDLDTRSTHSAPEGSRRAGFPRRRAGGLPWLPVAVATVILFAASAVFVPAAVTGTSMQAMLPFAALMALAGVGQTLVIQQRGLDLSAAGMITLAASITVILGTEVPLPVVLIVVLLASVATGLVNGFMVDRLSITPLIATLASNAVLTGAVWWVSGGGTGNAPTGLSAVVTARVLGQPAVVWFCLTAVVVAALIMSRTSFGRRFVISGASQRAAAVLGIRSGAHVMIAYTASAVLSGATGILLVAYLRTSSLSIGDSYQLTVIAAVVVGGTSLLGGRGSVVATAIAAVFLTQLAQAALTLGAPSSTQLVLQSIAIALAASIGILAARRSKRRSPTRARGGR